MWVTNLRELTLKQIRIKQNKPKKKISQKTHSQNKIIKVQNVLWLFILTSIVWV